MSCQQVDCRLNKMWTVLLTKLKSLPDKMWTVLPDKMWTVLPHKMWTVLPHKMWTVLPDKMWTVWPDKMWTELYLLPDKMWTELSVCFLTKCRLKSVCFLTKCGLKSVCCLTKCGLKSVCCLTKCGLKPVCCQVTVNTSAQESNSSNKIEEESIIKQTFPQLSVESSLLPTPPISHPKTEFIDNLRIERKLFTKLRTNDISLHIFCDASPKAYGAVAYFRYITEEGSAKASFIISESKVAPLKTLTLARLELMAALIGARLAKYLQDTFPSLIKRVYLWSDSKIVIHWVKGSAKVWKPFVCNRVTQVQLLISPHCWNHCSGSENPADLTTRGESANAFLSSSLWSTGPEWLSRPVHSWPVQCLSILSDSICDKEIFSSERQRTETVNTMVVTTYVDDCISSCINIDKYSNLRKLLRVTAFVKRFMNNSKPGSLKFSGPLSAFELQEALHSWIKATQNKYFGAEMHQLLSKSVISKDSRVYNLSPELDENNLLQLKGRLQFSSGDMRAKHPWLLPSNDKFVKLLILDTHFKMGHLGVEVSDWYHIPGKLNPADCATRGLFQSSSKMHLIGGMVLIGSNKIFHPLVPSLKC
ncbi:hypothetical protein HNY73_013454 [Argiope bruennichi]|uniref:Integrase zinc-binding domain-containing protein n=1 Tax=Argiope bruennichi TaxID=94029 RepID=A0A8T0F2T8_ARGBR|nr:hypothetical protein HNY73_013454 [Argiope bruennichi]